MSESEVVAPQDTTNSAPNPEAPKVDSAPQAEPKAEPVKVEATKQEPVKVVPEKYELKLSDDSILSADEVDKISTYAKEKGLSNEEAQELLNLKDNAVKSYHESQKQLLEQKQSEWLEATKADKEIGGDKLNESVELAKRVITKYGSDSFVNMLEETGFGNHPEVVRVFSKIGRLMANDKYVMPGSNAGGAKSYEDIFYGNNNNKES